MLVMVYVWQHFAAIEVGYHVEAQKSQVEQLREDNRQLRLSEAQLSDPGRIDKIAKQLGLDTPQPGQVVRPDGSDANAPVLAQAGARLPCLLVLSFLHSHPSHETRARWMGHPNLCVSPELTSTKLVNQMRQTPRQMPRQSLTAPIRRVRFTYVALFFVFWSAAIGMRLFWLQVVRHSDFVKRAAMQQQRTFEVAPRRGVLYDRNLRELAMTVLVDSVYAVPSELGENRENAAQILAKIVHADAQDNFTSQQQILARFTASKNFAWVARRLDPETANRVRELNLHGIYLQKEFKRFYPEQRPRGAGAGVCRHRRQRAGRSGAAVRPGHARRAGTYVDGSRCESGMCWAVKRASRNPARTSS